MLTDANKRRRNSFSDVHLLDPLITYHMCNFPCVLMQSAGVEVAVDAYPEARSHGPPARAPAGGGPRGGPPQQRVGVLMIQLCSATLRFTTPISPAVKISIGKQVA